MDATYDYNKLISSRILDNYDRMINNVPQATMFGGKRMRNFVLPGSTDYDYPGSLSVGTMDGKTPQTLSSAFWNDFGNGFHTPVGGVKAPEVITPKRKGRRYVAGAVEEREGGSKKSTRAFVKGLKKFGKAVAPVAKDVGIMLLKEGLKEGIKHYTKTPASAPAPKGGRRKKCEGGVLIRNEPGEFHSSVYPPALASYTAGKDAYGRGRGKAKSKGGAKRSSARGAIVKEVMKKHGLSLPEASKYVKTHNLY